LHAYISKNGKSYETSNQRGNALDLSTIRCNAQIRCRPKDLGWSARTETVQKKNN